MSEKEKITKLMKVYVKAIGDETDIDYDKPTIMVSYQAIPSDKGRLFRETVRVLNNGTPYRYYGKTPIVFVALNDMKNLEVLNIANIVKKSLENEDKVSHERSIKYVIKNVLRGKSVALKKVVFYGAMGDIMLKRPNKDYVAFSNAMYENVVETLTGNGVSGTAKIMNENGDIV